jgi:uncharacterized pyridoxal phosphate-containing UPF0001 family protein
VFKTELIGKIGDNKIGVVVQVVDIFNNIDKEELEEVSEKEEFKAQEKTINDIQEKFKEKGYKLVGFFTREEVDKKLNASLALGINGVYLLIFKKSD